MIAQADVFMQNLAPAATERLGLGSGRARAQRYPRLVTCDISRLRQAGSGWPALKAYDLLVQAESGLVAVDGAPGEWGRIGVSLCDIGAGLNALIGIQQALMLRERTGSGQRHRGVALRLGRRADEPCRTCRRATAARHRRAWA
jgi:crotonobetainyl-CoA:carnitine CoA-transferase CaiB-like acyl-CoA transferase